MRKEFNNLDFGPIIPMGESEFGKAPEFPKAGEHPRLLFTKDMIPAIRKALDDPDYAKVRVDLDGLIADEFDGTLGIPYMHGVEGIPGRRGIHNFDAHGLISIESKAFAYAIWGDNELGYRAIDAMQNYLLTLNIRYIFCDQCREYGQIMLTAAKVYDWCYDLLTDDEKHRLIAGITNYAAAGCCGMTEGLGGDISVNVFRSYSGKNKMEVGYPPRGQGSVTGHGSEGQVTRDYLSVAIAVYDEHPDWWEYVGARVFNDYLVQRNYYYACGCTPQGNSCYGPYRLQFDLFAAKALTVLLGKNPFTDSLGKVPRSLYSYELPNGQHFSEGDFVHGGYGTARGAETSCALWASALYGDAALRAEVKHHRPDYSTDYFSTSSMTASEVIIALSDGLKPADNRHEGVSPVCYNCQPQHKLIARSAWDDPDAPVVYMKIGERTTANHEHRDAGAFQIFYKGMLSVDSGGGYSYYGTSAHFGQLSTMAHNSILVQTRTDGGFSDGNQRGMPEAINNTAWLENDGYKIAYGEGVSYSVKDGKCEYAYAAGNIAPAYNTDTEVEYLSRRMLSVFTGSRKNPLIFATFDSIVARSAENRKVIILNALPGAVVDGNVAIAKNSEASLVANYISPSELELCYYGEDEETAAKNTGKPNWGRIEVTPKLGNLRDDVLSVMYVKDNGDTDMPTVREIKSDDLLGAELLGHALLFVRDAECPDTLSVNTEASEEYMISGLSAGSWSASVGDSTVSFTVSETERFARINLPAGRITLIKA